MGALLDIAGLSVAYGQVYALHEVSLGVDEGSIVALLGANGAGKTSLLGAVAGIVRPRRGRIRLGGRDITGESAFPCPATVTVDGPCRLRPPCA